MTLVAAFADTGSPGEVLDISAVRTIVVSGDASDIRITTKPGEPYRAETRGRRGGWFSSWYSSWLFDSCRDRSQMHIAGTTLRVEVTQTSWMDLSDCTPVVFANVPSGSAVRVDQQTVKARFEGDFARLGISSKAADIALEGHASTVDILGAAVRARLNYDAIRRDERIDITAQSLEAELGFGRDVPVEYTVTAKAALVDSPSPSVSGARPLVTIKGDYVHARIR
jgi:hypothetical protein